MFMKDLLMVIFTKLLKTIKSKERLIKMGEIKERVFNVGCPSIDAIMDTPDDPQILERYKLSENDFFILLQHPVTSEIDESKEQIKITLSAIDESNINVLIILPNHSCM